MTLSAIQNPQRLLRLLGAARMLAEHEAKALAGRWAALRERFAVASQARGLGELVRDQIDLWPETRMRLAADRRARRVLLKCLARDLRRR